MRVLLLNATYEPLSFITERQALKLLARERVEIIETWKNFPIRTVSTMFDLPATLRLKSYVRIQFKRPRFTKFALFNRDGWKCQYCGKEIDISSATIDHVHPKSLGGKTVWNNCVACCKICNRKKANQVLEDSGLTLLSKPTMPKTIHFWDRRVSKKWNSNWETYLGERRM